MSFCPPAPFDREQLPQETRTVPIVFVIVAGPGRRRLRQQPVAAGRQRNWLHAVRIQPERKMAGAAQAGRAGRHTSGGVAGCRAHLRHRQFAVIQSVASSVGVEVSPVNVHDAGEIERAVAAFARSPNGGLVVTSSALVVRHRELIVGLATRHNLPAVYYRRLFVDDGGLVSYGYDLLDQFRRAATYVDRIFKGEQPADLPVQAPTKYELVINLKAARALGIEVPSTLLARADEVIE